MYIFLNIVNILPLKVLKVHLLAKYLLYLYMNNALQQFKNIPVTSSVLFSVYPEIKQSSRKIGQLEKKGEIIRLRRGMYIVNPLISHKKISTELIANHLCSPSFISMHSALRYYGLIPERVNLMQSMTTKKARIFDNTFGRFQYIHTAEDSFYIGVTQESIEDLYFLIATPERALCDLIANTDGLTLRFKKEVQRFLEEDLRFDMDFFQTARISIFEEYAQIAKKKNSIITLIKWLRDERAI